MLLWEEYLAFCVTSYRLEYSARRSPICEEYCHSFVPIDADAEEGGGGDDYEDDVPDRGGDEYSFEMFDPVWGKPDYPPGHLPSARQV